MDKNDLSGTFEKIGLSEKESIVYSCLLTLGGAFPSKIAEETKLNRSTVYKILLDLSIKGLVNEIKKRNKAYYQLERPEKLVRYVKGQVNIANDNLEKAQKLLPDIEGLYSLITHKPKISYFEGKEGLMSIYEDMVDNQKKYEMLAISNISEFEKIFPKNFFKDFRRSKERIGITTRGIVPDTEADTTFTERLYEGYKKEVIPKIKIIPASQFPFKGEVTIYGESKVAIVNLNKEFLTGIIIEDKTIHNIMKMTFELSWKGIV